MSCYHPMVLINTSDMSDPSQRAIVERLRLVHKHNDKIRSVNTILIPREIALHEGVDLQVNKAVLVPCGRCIGCRLDYSREWAVRCVKEAEQHEHNYFLTLTYDDEHLPIGSKGVPTIINDEISSFMKSFREAMRTKFGVTGIRFFACSEYGDQQGERLFNPHFHFILFNCPIPDLQERHPVPVDGKIKMIKQYDSSGELLLYSPLIGSIWKNGSAKIGHVTFESCAYVSRYVTKKQYGDGAEIYKQLGIQSPSVRMSRMPGIGAKWFLNNLDKIYELDNFNFKRGDDVITMKPGRYCDKLLQKVDEQRFYDIKKQRHEAFYDGVDCKTFEHVDVMTNNHNAEREKLRAAKLLKRNL